MWNSMRYVHAYPSHAYVCIFHALRGKRNHPPRVENARVRFLRPPHNGHRDYFSMVEIKVTRVHLVRGYIWTNTCTRTMRVRMEALELSPVCCEFEDGWNGTLDVRMFDARLDLILCDWISLCSIMQFSFWYIYIYRLVCLINSV